MNYRRETMIRNKYAAFALYVFLTILFYNALDFVHKTYVTGAGYHFTFGGDLITPVLIGSCLFLLTTVKK